MKTFQFILAFVLFLCAAQRLYAQQVTEYSFGDGDWNNVAKIWEVPNGNINLLTGESDGFPGDIVLYQMTPQGEILWKNAIAAGGGGSLLAETDDDGSLWFGHLSSDGYTITHFASDGNPMSDFTFSHPDLWDDYHFSVRRTPDKQHFVIAFLDQDPPMGIRIVKLTLTGTLVFNKYIGTNDPISYPEFYSSHMAVLSSGRIVVAFIDPGWLGYGFYCFSPSGTQLWIGDMYQAPDFAEECSIVPLSNGNFVWHVRDGVEDGHAVCISSNGSLLWEKKLIEILPAFRPFKAFADGDHTILAGDTDMPSGLGLGVIKLDANGNLLFAQTYPKLDGVEEFEATINAHGDYVFSGFTWECCYHNDRSYFLSMQPDGLTNWLVYGQNTINHIGAFCHASNGDQWMGGNFKDPGSSQMRNNYLLKVSDLPPAYPQLLTGRVVLDESGNCLAEQNEPVLSYHIVRADAGGTAKFAVSDPNGNYVIRLPDAGNANVHVLTPNSLWQPCQPSFEANFANSDSVELDLPVSELAQCPILRLDAGTQQLRRCFDNNYEIGWCNEGSSDALSATLTIELDSFFTYVSSSIPLSSQNGSTVTFSLGDIPKNGCGHLQLVVNVSCDAELGHVHCLSSNITATNGCPAYEDGLSLAIDCQPNIGSYDPNDIRAFANDSLVEVEILAGTGIEYQVRFQNTGTDTAFNISIIDTLSNLLDLGTLQMGTSSHLYTWEIRNGNLLKITFSGINLPHSSFDQLGSQGFVQYSISQKPFLSNGSKIYNSAAIYFDFNERIATNLHQLIIKNSVATKEPHHDGFGINMFPNPVSNGVVRIDSKNKAQKIVFIEVFNMTGQLLKSFSNDKHWIDIELPPSTGLFLIIAQSENGEVAAIKVIGQ
ncbi:MAG: T9SS type A sorting domain-containing protein [Bacteroidetes bacterium]|nr:T9SS type A sorting domain-containing protein [Bacteroidota bacterium]